MARQLDCNGVVFFKRYKKQNDTLDQDDLLFAIMSDMPLFYFWTEGQNVPDNLDKQCGTSANNAYQELLEERAQEPEPEDLEDDDPFGLNPISEDACPAIADRDINWLEYDHTEEDFDLDEVENSAGFTIIVFPTSVMVLAPEDKPVHDERTILDGFDTQAPNIPKDVIHCHGQIPS